MDNFNLETFVGLHIYLVAADLIYNILDKFISILFENFLSPLVETLLGDSVKNMYWKIGKDEKDVINIGIIIKETLKLFMVAILLFNIYTFFKRYKKYRDVKNNI